METSAEILAVSCGPSYLKEQTRPKRLSNFHYCQKQSFSTQ